MAKYVVALDQGTTSTRCMVFNMQGEAVASHQREHQQICPHPGWVEHDPLEVWERTKDVVRGSLDKAGLAASDLAAIGIANQRETTVVWNRRTGQPYCNAIVWQDTRTDLICNRLAENGGQDRFRAKTGLPLATYFSGPKIRWMLDNVPGLRRDAETGEALFGNIDSWLIWKLTGGPSEAAAHVTDATNASRTMLMNLENSGMGRRDSGGAGDSAGAAAGHSPVLRSVVLRIHRALTDLSAAKFRSAAILATSRRRLSGRPASTWAKPRTHMAPAALCC